VRRRGSLAPTRTPTPTRTRGRTHEARGRDRDCRWNARVRSLRGRLSRPSGCVLRRGWSSFRYRSTGRPLGRTTTTTVTTVMGWEKSEHGQRIVKGGDSTQASGQTSKKHLCEPVAGDGEQVVAEGEIRDHCFCLPLHRRQSCVRLLPPRRRRQCQVRVFGRQTCVPPGARSRSACLLLLSSTDSIDLAPDRLPKVQAPPRPSSRHRHRHRNRPKTPGVLNP
jgi:hypothetical protein